MNFLWMKRLFFYELLISRSPSLPPESNGKVRIKKSGGFWPPLFDDGCSFLALPLDGGGCDACSAACSFGGDLAHLASE